MRSILAVLVLLLASGCGPAKKTQSEDKIGRMVAEGMQDELMDSVISDFIGDSDQKK